VKVPGRKLTLALAAGAGLVLLAAVLVGAVMLTEEQPPQRQAVETPEAPEFPLEFPSQVFDSPEPPPAMFQQIEVGEPEEDLVVPPDPSRAVPSP